VAQLRQAHWEWKRAACIDALNIVEAAFANAARGGKEPLPFDLQRIRSVYDALALSYENSNVVNQYADLITVGREQRKPIGSRTINEFRNCLRAELGFPGTLPDEAGVWIGRITVFGSNIVERVP